MSLLWVSISTISLTNSAYRFYQFCYTQTLIRLGMGIDYHYHYPCCTEDHRFDFSLGWSRTRIWRTFQGGREPKRASWGRLGREGAACKCGLVLKKTCFCPTKSAWQSLLEPNISGCVSCDVRLSWRAGQHLFKDGEQECALGMKSGHSVQLLHPNLPRALVQLLSDCVIKRRIWVGCGPLTGFQWPPGWHYIFRIGDPYKPSFSTVTGRGPYPRFEPMRHQF